MRRSLLALPFVLVVAVATARSIVGIDAGLLPLMALVPAMAALVSPQMPADSRPRAVYVTAAGVTAVAGAIASGLVLDGPATREIATIVAIAAVTVISIAIARHQKRIDVNLARITVVADMVQSVILRVIPERIGPVSLAARYVSADPYAHVGGDFYEVVRTARGVRLVVGDVQGKGLPAVQIMVLALGIFREAAHRESSITGIAVRMDNRLGEELGDEQFVTAVIADIDTENGAVQFVCCGHPPPVLFTPAAIAACPGSPGLPLGTALGLFFCQPGRVPFKPGHGMLFYTDGLSEARNAEGVFFPLLERLSHRPPEDLVGELAQEVAQYARGARDDMALLAVRYDELP